MLEEILGKIIYLLPLEVLMILSIMAALWKFGTLQRLAVMLNLWLRAMIDANKARQDFQQRLEELHVQSESKIDEIHAQSVTQAMATYNLEQSRFRQLLLSLLQEDIAFLQNEVKKNNDFFREHCLNEFKRDSKKENIKDHKE